MDEFGDKYIASEDQEKETEELARLLKKKRTTNIWRTLFVLYDIGWISFCSWVIYELKKN